jgi:hypothetical protein
MAAQHALRTSAKLLKIIMDGMMKPYQIRRADMQQVTARYAP